MPPPLPPNQASVALAQGLLQQGHFVSVAAADAVMVDLRVLCVVAFLGGKRFDESFTYGIRPNCDIRFS